MSYLRKLRISVSNVSRLLFWIALGFFWFVLSVYARVSLEKHPGSLPGAVAVFIILTAVSYITVNRWITLLPGVYGYAVVNATYATLSSNLPGATDKMINLSDGVLAIMLLSVGTYVSYGMTKKSLSIGDKLTLAFCPTMVIIGSMRIFPLWIGLLIAISPLFVALCTKLMVWVIVRRRAAND